MAEETDGRDNDVGTATQESPGQVVQLPRDWFGPREELVPVGPQARRESEGAGPRLTGVTGEGAHDAAPGEDASGPAADPDASARAPMAVDFWGGVTAVEDLVPFPSHSTHQASARRSTRNEGAGSRGRRLGARAHLLRSVQIGSGRTVSVGVAVFICALIGVRVLTTQLMSGRAGAGAQKLAHVQGSSPGARSDWPIDLRDEPRSFGLRRLPAPRGHSAARRQSAPRRHFAARHRARVGGAAHTSSLPRVTSGQPVSYSAPSSAQTASTSSGASTGTASNSSSAGGSSGAGGGGTGDSGGGHGSGGGSSKPGPTGPGAAFGPGTLGK